LIESTGTRCRFAAIAVATVALTAAVGVAAAAGKKPLTFADLMSLRKIEAPVISQNGSFVAYALRPDRGEGSVVARAADRDTSFRVERGGNPLLSSDARWLACAILPTQRERDEAAARPKDEGENDDDGPRNGMAVVSLADGAEERLEEVESFAFSEDARWIAWKHHEPREDDDAEAAADAEPSTTEGKEKEEKEEEDDRPVGTLLVLRNLHDGTRSEIPYVTAYVFDEPSRHLAYAVATPDGEGNGLHVRMLDGRPAGERRLHGSPAGRYTQLAWAEESSRLAFVAAVDDEDHDPGPADVWWWDGSGRGEAQRLAASDDAPEGWRIPSVNALSWSRDGARLFFGHQWIDPVREDLRLRAKAKAREERERARAEEAGRPLPEEPYDPSDFDALLDRRKLDVWHGKDPYIVPHQRKAWKKEKDRVWLAVAHLDSGKIVRLADREVPDVTPANNPRAVLATSNLPYRRELTWDGSYVDVYHVSLIDGERSLVAERLREGVAELSPDGRYVAFWRDPAWYLWDADRGTTRDLTGALAVPFADEDDDYPAADPGYGIADWIEGDRAILLYDKFDVWRFPTGAGDPLNLTGGRGREERRIYRVVDLDPERDHVRDDEWLLLHGYHDLHKNDGFWRTRANGAALRKLLEDDRRFRFVAKAEEADRLLYTRESYDEFPDLWVAGPDLAGRRKLSDANPELARFARGHAELVEWISADGIPLQGVLIKPANYDPDRRYPVLVYFYRFMSQRLHEFNEPVINHRPSFPVYASDGYAVFLPDIRFEIGRPGLSAVKALVPGVQKLIETGLADPAAIGLHGHSWSGYQTAFVVTQTDIFRAAVAGAPVSNMTSAYSGIRLGTGLARQFQYEQSQSRIGGSLDAELPKYLENSPVFLARHVRTPLLIQFGDRDEAVPWQQGIELYLALRRLDKNVIFLQYRGEPHHLKQYPNKLDYSIKMKEFFDHHLKGEPAPEWMTEGVPYRGE